MNFEDKLILVILRESTKIDEGVMQSIRNFRINRNINKAKAYAQNIKRLKAQRDDPRAPRGKTRWIDHAEQKHGKAGKTIYRLLRKSGKTHGEAETHMQHHTGFGPDPTWNQDKDKEEEANEG